jgi:hypothetical protein
MQVGPEPDAGNINYGEARKGCEARENGIRAGLLL